MKISKPDIIQKPLKENNSKEKINKNDNTFEKILNKTMKSEKTENSVQKTHSIAEPMPVKFLNINEHSPDYIRDITKVLDLLDKYSNDINNSDKTLKQIEPSLLNLINSAEELNLSYFAAYSQGIPFGTLDKIKNVISEYKKHGIDPALLETESEKLSGGEKNKALDIAAIYRLYLKKCKS